MNGNPTAGTPSVSPIPQLSISTSPAPGKRGPTGTGPRNNNSTVHTGTPAPSGVGVDSKMVPPNTAGMLPQRSALPAPQVPQIKVSEVRMGSQVARPTVQEMIKAAIAGTVGRAEISAEAERQAGNMGEKIASSGAANDVEKVASYDEVMQLADAVEYINGELSKEAQPGEGPGALTVMESPGGSSLPDKKGQAKHVVPTSTPLQNNGGGATTQVQNDHGHRPGGSQTQQTSMRGGSKTASAIREASAKLASDKGLEQKETEGMSQAQAGLDKAKDAHEQENKTASLASQIRSAAGQEKKAEDAINPAQISSGAATPPDTRKAGESGGASPPGASAVSSNEGVKNLTRRDAKAQPKADMKAYVDEPALSASHDSVLQAAFKHTSEAGAKIASAAGVPGFEKAAAAKALINRIAEAQKQA